MRTQALVLVTGLAAIALAIGAPAMAEDPYAMPDDSWISLSGTVVSAASDHFLLDYGDGVVTVEMDDWDTYGDAYGLLDGDKVTVYGRVDDDLFETTTIEAGSVYVESLNTYFYASSADEETVDYTVHYWGPTTPLVIGDMTLRGTVTGTNPEEQQFTIDTGTQQISVETDRMAYNPLDEAGFQKIEVDDRVSVSGEIDYDFLEGREFEAVAVVTLSDADAERKPGS